LTSNLIYIEWELDNQQKLIYMKKNHYGKNGSHIEPFLQKELPILSSLKFIKPFQINGLNRTWSLSQYWRKLGVYVIKDEQKERINMFKKGLGGNLVTHYIYQRSYSKIYEVTKKAFQLISIFKKKL